MTYDTNDRLNTQPDDENEPLLTDLSPTERADLQEFVDDEAARAAEEDLPPVEVAASVLVAQSDVLDDVTSLTETNEPEIGPLTLKEAYGESIGRALEWSDTAQLCAVYSGGDDEEAYVDAEGLCACWSFTYRNPSSQYLDLVVLNGQIQVSDLEFSGTPGNAFILDDLLDSPDIIADAYEQGLEGDGVNLSLERDESGVLRALVVRGDQQIVVDPAITYSDDGE